MNEQGSPPQERLDSWKAIADYLGKDVATVRRWERLHKLPVRRIAGPGRSVFAYVSEINEWLRAMPSADLAPTADAPDTPSAIDVPLASSPSKARGRLLMTAAAAVVLFGVFRTMPLLTSSPMLRAEMTADGIVAYGRSGAELWRHPFSPEDRNSPRATYSVVRVLSGTNPGVLAATAYYEQFNKGLRGGELLWFTRAGTLERTFSFNDRLEFAKPYGEPWVLSDFSVTESNGERRIAISAHHNEWWPAIVTVLDGQWKRKGTFVNAGWVNQVQWLSRDRLLISGFSNAHEGGMIAVLDVRTLDGQSPPGTEAEYTCASCGPVVPVRYVVLPRSEVNEASGGSLNGALVMVQDDRIIVRTIEKERSTESVEALYEFTPALELVRASYGDRYWEMHKTLEAEGKIDHPRDRCPDRDGPQGMKAWEAPAGWRPLK